MLYIKRQRKPKPSRQIIAHLNKKWLRKGEKKFRTYTSKTSLTLTIPLNQIYSQLNTKSISNPKTPRSRPEKVSIRKMLT